MKDTAKNLSLFHLTWPIFIELLLQVLVVNIDQYMISHYSEAAVGAVGNAGQIINVLTLTFTIISTAITVLASQYLGAKQKEKVATIYTLGFTINCIFSILISTIMLLLGRTIFSWMHLPDVLIEDAVTYLNIIGGFIIFNAIFLTISAIFKSIALVKYSMWISVIMNLVNILGNAVLMYGLGPFPEMGVSGAAWATTGSRLLGMILILVVFIRKSDIHFSFHSLYPFPIGELKKMMDIGIPSAGESISYDLSQMIILAFINTFGAFVINTKIYAGNIAWITCIFTSAISYAAQVIIGRYIGAGKYDEAERQTWKILRISMIVTAFISFSFFLFAETILGIFTSNVQILALGKQILFLEFFLDIGRCGNLILIRSLQAAGDTKFPVAVGICSMWIVSVGLSYCLGVLLGWGLIGVWVAMACDELIRMIIFIIRTRSGKWRNRSYVSI